MDLGAEKALAQNAIVVNSCLMAGNAFAQIRYTSLDSALQLEEADKATC